MEQYRDAGIWCVSVDREAEVIELNWTDVLRSLDLSYDLLSATAEEVTERDVDDDPAGWLMELDERLDRIAASERR